MKISIAMATYNGAENIGSAINLKKDEVALVKITKRKTEDLPNNPFYEDSIVKSSNVDDQVYQEEELFDPTVFDEPADKASSLLNLGLENYKSSKFIDAKFYFENVDVLNSSKRNYFSQKPNYSE